MSGTLFVRSALTHWRSVAAFAVLGTAATGLLAAARTPEFHAHLQLIVTFTPVRPSAQAMLAPAIAAEAGPTVDATSAVAIGHAFGADERLIESRVRGYAQKATSTAITGQVSRALALGWSPDELGAHIAAWSPLNTTLIDIEVRDADRGRAARIADAIGEALVEAAKAEPLPPNDPAPLRLELAARQAAIVPVEPEPVPWRPYLAGGALAGLAIGTGLAMQRALLRRRGDTMRDWVRQRLAAVQSFARLANKHFWGPGWR
ncbi:hypothetical protein ACQP00_05180 [Dactylosporangium sp. CS-047395]|uniref:hypothetical protein n=1 Tax=Dactylosporangium sp. CS-047395 TaxID=3239936 RepID=UPI003D8D80C4